VRGVEGSRSKDAVAPGRDGSGADARLHDGGTATMAATPWAPELALRPLPDRNDVVPVAEMVLFNAGLWAVDRYALDSPFARVDARSMGANLRGGWWYDSDDFQTNQILHPYQGSVYHTIARSAGWGFWRALLLDFAGSLTWKIAGESGPPATNDQITTTLGGAILGEALFRTSRLVLDAEGRPGIVRWMGSALIAPAAAVNDVVLGGTIAEPDPPSLRYLGRLSFGAMAGTAMARTGEVRIRPAGFLSVRLVHGLPGELEPDAPFGHFVLELDFSSATAEPWQQLDRVGGPTWFLRTRGLIVGGDARLGAGGGMLYGLFGTFDYGGPVLLRVAESGLGPGLVLALRPSPAIDLGVTLLASATFGSGGAWVPPTIDRDYRYGYGALLLADSSLWLWGHVELGASGRAYLVPSAVGGGEERFLIGKGALRLRMGGPHAVGVEGTLTQRWASYPGSAYAEHAAMASLSYSYLLGGGGR
jgi:hypothetical protein